jgi:hypothetical protein
MSSEDSVRRERKVSKGQKRIANVLTWNLVSVETDFVNRCVVSVALDFRLLQALIHLLAMLLPLACKCSSIKTLKF